MAQIAIEITRGEGETKTSFQPDPIEVTTQDIVFWINNDTQPHWPMRTDGTLPSQIWMEYPIPRDTSSSGVTFFNPDTITNQGTPYTVEYFCAVEGHEGETGTIKVTS